jgi:hypothetical protein
MADSVGFHWHQRGKGGERKAARRKVDAGVKAVRGLSGWFRQEGEKVLWLP